MATTTKFAIPKPTVGGDSDSWGTSLNTGMDTIDTYMLSCTGYRSDGTTVVPMTGPLALAVGSAAAPGLNFSGDVNTGLYWIGADSFGISTGGTLRVTYSTTAQTIAAAFKTNFPAATSSQAPINLGYAATGVNPSSPSNADVWANADGFFVRIAGTTYNLIAPVTGGVTTFNTRSGAVTLSSSDVTTALGFTPVTNARTVTGTGMLTGGGALSSNQTITLAAVADQRILGNVSGGSAVPSALTAAQVATMIGGSINLSSATIGTADVTGDGYLKIGSVYVMWGTSSATTGDGGTVTITLPVTISAILEGSVQATARNTAGTANINVEYQYYSSDSTSNVVFYVNEHGSGATPAGFNWFAIGLA